MTSKKHVDSSSRQSGTSAQQSIITSCLEAIPAKQSRLTLVLLQLIRHLWDHLIKTVIGHFLYNANSGIVVCFALCFQIVQLLNNLVILQQS